MELASSSGMAATIQAQADARALQCAHNVRVSPLDKPILPTSIEQHY